MATALDSAAARRLPARGRLTAARRDPVVLVIAAATAVGLVLRLWQLSRPGYLLGVTEYDDGPYFGSAVLLVHGALPYRNFILVQPPGITLLMAPAALVGQVAGTAAGMATGRILTALASAAGILLAGLLVRHRGPVAALVACGVLAVYPDSVAAAHTVLVEPWLVLFCLAGAVAVLDRDRITASTGRLAWGGAAFGCAGAVESWAILPVLVLLGLCWSGGATPLEPPGAPMAPGRQAGRPHRARWPGGATPLEPPGAPMAPGRRAGRPHRARWPGGTRPGTRRARVFAGGVTAGFAVLVLPFAVLAPGRFYDSLIVAQVGPRAGVNRVPLIARLQEMAGLSYAHFPLRAGGIRVPGHTAVVLTVAFLVLLTAGVPALAALAAWARPAPLDWFAAGTMALVVAIFLWPSQFHYHFCAFLAPFLGLAIALPLATALRAGHGPGWPVRAVAAVAAVILAGCTVAGFAAAGKLKPDVSPATIAAAARRIPPGSCVVTDEVSLLLLAGRFTATVPGCPPVLDGLGTDLALSGGLKPATGAGQVPAVATVWWQAFSDARFVWLSRLNHRRIAWTPALRGYFRSHFTRVLTDPRGDALYQRTAPGGARPGRPGIAGRS